jgi:hypothetical protein
MHARQVVCINRPILRPRQFRHCLGAKNFGGEIKWAHQLTNCSMRFESMVLDKKADVKEKNYR